MLVRLEGWIQLQLMLRLHLVLHKSSAFYLYFHYLRTDLDFVIKERFCFVVKSRSNIKVFAILKV